MLINSTVHGLSLFIIDGLFVGLASWHMVKWFKADHFLEQLIFFALISSAIIIASTYTLSLLRQIQPFGYLIFHLVFFFGVFLFRTKRHTGFVQRTINLSKAGEIKEHPLIAIIGISVGVFLITSFFWDFLCRPTIGIACLITYLGWDIGCRMGPCPLISSRIHDSSIYCPMLKSCCSGRSFFLKSDVLAFLPQWVSYVGVMGLVFLLARHLKFSLFPSLFSAFIWASCTEIMLEATTVQNDLVLTFFLTTGVYFFLKGLRERDRKTLFASAIAFGIALGTKGVALFILPGLLVCSIIYVYAGFPSINDASAERKGELHAWHKRDTDRRFLRSWFFYIVFCFMVLGSYMYVQNFFCFSYPLGPKVILDTHSTFSFHNMVKNLVFIAWRFFDTSGLTFLRIPGFYHGASFHEDSAGYGLSWLGFCVPAGVYFIYKIVRKDARTLFLMVFALGFLFSFCISLFKDPWYFRLLIPFTAFIAPLSAIFYPGPLYEFPRRKIRFFYCSVFVLAAVIQVMTVAFFNPSKPLYVLPALQRNRVFKEYVTIFQMDRHEMRYLPFTDLKLDEMEIYRELDRVSRPNDRIGIIVSGNDWDYPAFGDHFQRHVFPVIYHSEDEVERLAAAKPFDYVIIFGPSQKFENFNADLEPLIHSWLQRGASSSFVLLKNSGHLYLFGVKRASL